MAISINIPGDEIQLTGNRITVECSGAAAPAGSTRYMVVLKITSTDGKLEGSPFFMAKAPKESGNIDFNIGAYVDQYLTAVFQWPIVGIGVTRASQIFNIQIQAGERYIDENGELQDAAVTDTWDSSATIKALKGGLSQRQVNYMNDSNYSFYDKYLVPGKWLTARPWGDYVHPTQPVKLWFLPVASSAATLNIQAWYNDGSDAITANNISLDSNNLYEFNVNPTVYGISMETGGKKITHFDVWLSGITSESRRFTVDWIYCERPVFLMFANTFGGVDDVYLSGQIEDKFETQGEISYRESQETDTKFTPTLLSLDKTGQNRWVINTGYKPRSTILYLRDLLISKQAWYLHSQGDVNLRFVVPVIIDNASKPLLNSNADLYSFDIEISEAHISKHSFDNRVF